MNPGRTQHGGNAKLKTGHGPHSSQLVNCVVLCNICVECVVLCIVCVDCVFICLVCVECVVLCTVWVDYVVHVLFVCKCVPYYCYRVATQLQLTNISYQIYQIQQRLLAISYYLGMP